MQGSISSITCSAFRRILAALLLPYAVVRWGMGLFPRSIRRSPQPQSWAWRPAQVCNETGNAGGGKTPVFWCGLTEKRIGNEPHYIRPSCGTNRRVLHPARIGTYKIEFCLSSFSVEGGSGTITFSISGRRSWHPAVSDAESEVNRTEEEWCE